jgi:hypothetical protein
MRTLRLVLRRVFGDRVVDADAEREDEDGSYVGNGLLCKLNGILEVTLTICL